MITSIEITLRSEDIFGMFLFAVLLAAFWISKR
jgi:hypothetical protein